MPVPRRLAANLSFLTVAACVLAGCGGGHKPTIQPASQAAMGSVHPPGWGHPPPGNRLQAPRPLTGVSTAEQFDTITLNTIPSGASWLAGYTAGFWPTYNPLLALPWHPHVKSIAIASRWHAHCLDIEPGDAIPAAAPGWWRADRAAGFARPCLYSSFWEFTNQVIPAMARAGIPRSAYWGWDANYTFRSHVDAGFDCTQWTDRAFGRNLDESTCTLAFLGANPPKPKPARVRWSSAEVQITSLTGACTATAKRGRWTASNGCRVHSMPFNARPLGG